MTTTSGNGGWSLAGEVVQRGALGGAHAQVRNGLPVGTKLYTVAEALAPTFFEMLEAGVDAADTLKAIGARIGYGRSQQILGEEWDLRYGCAPRGSMGVTANDVLLEALRVAHGHIDMEALRVSHCKDAAVIAKALGEPSAAQQGAEE